MWCSVGRDPVARVCLCLGAGASEARGVASAGGWRRESESGGSRVRQAVSSRRRGEGRGSTSLAYTICIYPRAIFVRTIQANTGTKTRLKSRIYISKNSLGIYCTTQIWFSLKTCWICEEQQVVINVRIRKVYASCIGVVIVVAAVPSNVIRRG